MDNLFNTMVIQKYAPTTDAEEKEVPKAHSFQKEGISIFKGLTFTIFFWFLLKQADIPLK